MRISGAKSSPSRPSGSMRSVTVTDRHTWSSLSMSRMGWRLGLSMPSIYRSVPVRKDPSKAASARSQRSLSVRYRSFRKASLSPYKRAMSVSFPRSWLPSGRASAARRRSSGAAPLCLQRVTMSSIRSTKPRLSATRPKSESSLRWFSAAFFRIIRRPGPPMTGRSFPCSCKTRSQSREKDRTWTPSSPPRRLHRAFSASKVYCSATISVARSPFWACRMSRS